MNRNRVLVKPDPAKEKEGELYIAHENTPNPTGGEVIAIGPGRVYKGGTLVPVCVAVGDRVRFNAHSVDEVKIDGQDYLVMDDQNILCIL